jgi:anti-sigma B factor antagonist
MLGGFMSLNVKTRKVDGVIVVDLSGRLTIGEPVLLLRETLRVQVNEGVRHFVLNLGDVSYIDSSGLGELVSAYTTIRNKQGDVKLLNLTAKAKDLLQMTKLLTVFDVYEDEAKAINNLKASKTSA